MVKTNITLDVSNNGTQATLFANQYEAESRTVYISLVNDGRKIELDDSHEAFVYANINGNDLTNACTIEDGKIIFTFRSAYLIANTKYELNVRLQKADGDTSRILFSPKVQVVVGKSIYNDDAVTGTTEYTEFTNAIAEMKSSQISSITEDVEGLIHTYTIRFANGHLQQFTLKDGEAGAKGEKGDKGDAGEKGDKGDRYILTDEDISEITNKLHIEGLYNPQISVNGEITESTVMVVKDLKPDENILAIDLTLTKDSKGVPTSQAVLNYIDQAIDTIINGDY